MKAKIFLDKDEFVRSEEPGICLRHWSGKKGRLMTRLPTGDFANLPIKLPEEPDPKITGEPYWDVQPNSITADGQLTDEVTLTSSIDCKGAKRWHGHLTKGDFVECG